MGWNNGISIIVNDSLGIFHDFLLTKLHKSFLKKNSYKTLQKTRRANAMKTVYSNPEINI